ncbi:MAG: flippase-like domain-containing protein [Defluviitaleaceae bacterium]|nr:flippase-like domain-containing protein [Defluviitaleaceae bacterium]
MKWLKFVIAAVVLLFLVLAILQLDPESLLDAARQIPVWSIILLFALQILTQLLVNIQWHQIAKSFGSTLKFTEILFINAGADIIHITPGGHISCEVFRALKFKDDKEISGEKAAAIVAIQKLFSLSAFFSISLISVGFFLSQVPWMQGAGSQALLYGVMTAILAAFATMFTIPHKILKPLKARWQNPRRLRAFILASLEHIIYLKSHSKILIKLLIIAASIWLLYPAKLYLIAYQLMPDVGVLHIMAITFLAYTVAVLPIFPGGLGGFELTMAGLLTLTGFTQAIALVITIIFRFATFWFVRLIALVIMGVYKLLKPKK